MKVLRLIFCALLLVICSASHAVTGCYIPSTGNLYPERVPGQPNYTYKTVIFVGNACLPAGSGTPATCFVNGGVGNGFEGNYSVANCPLDGTVWILIFATGLVGFFFVRKDVIIFPH